MITEEKLRLLSTYMIALVQKTEAIKIAREEFETSISDSLKEKERISGKIESIKSELSIEALAEFKKSGKKKLLGGIGIQERSSLTYDKDKAYDFAIEKQMFLQLDKKAFEKVVVSLHLPFVVIGTNTIATFPKEIKI